MCVHILVEKILPVCESLETPWRAVHDAFAVHVGEGLQNLLHDAGRLLFLFKTSQRTLKIHRESTWNSFKAHFDFNSNFKVDLSL